MKIIKALTVLALGIFCLTACSSKDTNNVAVQDNVAVQEENTETAEEIEEETKGETTEGIEKEKGDPMEIKEEMLEVGSVRLSVKEAGSGPDMILIHGRTLSKEAMDGLFEYYKDRYHVISYDVRGHGRTESGGPCTLDDLSDDLVGLIDAYQLEKPVVIGFSMGSYIALRTAERYPDLFKGIVLIGTRGQGQVSSFRISDEVAEAMETFDNMAEVANAAVPALVMSGENDFINPPEEGEKVAEALPDAEFKLVPGAEHEAYDDNPEFVFEQIDTFLQSLNK